MSLVIGLETIFFLFRVLYFYFIQSVIRAHKPVSILSTIWHVVW